MDILIPIFLFCGLYASGRCLYLDLTEKRRNKNMYREGFKDGIKQAIKLLAQANKSLNSFVCEDENQEILITLVLSPKNKS